MGQDHSLTPHFLQRPHLASMRRTSGLSSSGLMPSQEVIELSSDDDDDGPLQSLPRPAIFIQYPAEDLQIAIRSVSSQILQDSVIQLCRNVPGAAQYLSAALLTPKRNGKQNKRWAKCANCGEDFDLSTEGDDDECIYHPGSFQLSRYSTS
jgi:hypothetical protein